MLYFSIYFLSDVFLNKLQNLWAERLEEEEEEEEMPQRRFVELSDLLFIDISRNPTT